MPITGEGWEILIQRNAVQKGFTQSRTVGTYRVFHDGQDTGIFGTTAESPGPGSNATAGNKKRVEAGRYPLATQAGSKYVTHGYRTEESAFVKPKPGIELLNTGNRAEILIHPGKDFLRSVGCINLCMSLPNADEMISYPGSRRRVIALIEDLKAFLGSAFPATNGWRIPNAHAVIEGEP